MCDPEPEAKDSADRDVSRAAEMLHCVLHDKGAGLLESG